MSLMNLDEQIDNVLCKLATGYTRKQLLIYPEEDTGLDEYEIRDELLAINQAKQAISDLIKQEVLKARVDEVYRIQGCPPILLETTLAERLAELTNQIGDK